MIYVCRNKRNGFVKIGFTTNPKHREKTLQSEEPDVFFEALYEGTLRDEEQLHSRFANNRIRGEWFELTAEQLADIESILGNSASSLRKQIMDEFLLAIAPMQESDLSCLLERMRVTRAMGGPIDVVTQGDGELADRINELRHDWYNSGNPISDEQALQSLRQALCQN